MEKKIHVVWDSGHKHHRTLQKWQLLSFSYRDLKYYGRSRGKHEPAVEAWVWRAGNPGGGRGLTRMCAAPWTIGPLPSWARISGFVFRLPFQERKRGTEVEENCVLPLDGDTLIVNASVRLPCNILGDRQSGRVAAWLIFLLEGRPRWRLDNLCP